MGMVVNHNIPALQAYNSVSSTTNALQKSIQKLSTGLRINSAADDAAGLAISEKMRAQVRGLDQAVRNSQDGISMIQTAEGALNETHSILQRMRELSVQAANDTLTQQDRGYIQLEIDQLREEITRIGNTTQFNKKKLLDGSAAVLWSSDNLSTKAIVNGGLRQIDQFGQKSSLEGNYKISITANPGEAEVQKSDIFKIKHKNVIMDVSVNENGGVNKVAVDNLPAGTYNIETAGLIDEGAADSIIKTYGMLTSTTIVGSADITSDVNASVLLEVLHVNTGAGTVTLRATSKVLDVDGTVKTYVDENLVVDDTGAIMGASAYTKLGFTVAIDGAVVGITNYSGLGNSSKIVFNVAAGGTADVAVMVSATVNAEWPLAWGTAAGGTSIGDFGYNVDSTAVHGKDVHFRQFYLNTANGTVYEGDIVLSFNDKFSDDTDVSLASFEAAYIGQTAKGDVALRDLDKFWDSQGRFLLTDPQTITVTQGDGKKTNVTLYANDTLDDVAKKFNNAIANGLGQAQYVLDSADKFVTYVTGDEVVDGTSQSVEGTMVIRSLIAGNNGKISFAGDEDLIKAFSLNTIQDAKENNFRVSINDAHNGQTIASAVQITGNKLIGVINPNVDVQFDSMANIKVQWNESSKSFALQSEAEVYETILHLTDNTTVFQIGANEGEDMGINIGDMRSEALGLNSVLVTDRDSAARSITVIDNAMDKVSSQRAKLGAYQNRLEHTINNLTVAGENLTAAESRIRDTDMAKEMMNFTKLQIMLQAGTSMLAQANQLPNNVLSLLR